LGLGFLGFCLTHPWLSLNHGDSQVTLDMDARHLAETQPHNDQKLQDWDLPNQEQINKLKAESLLMLD
jgi:hypothetical protein